MKPPPERPVRIEIFSTSAHLPIVRGAVEKTCELLGFDDETAGSIVLSVDEALTNVIRHAYDGADDRRIEVELASTAGGDGLRITVRDDGTYVDPAQMRPRDLKDVRPGGLGVHIIRECMDDVSYARRDNGGTELTMTRRLSAERKEGPSP